MTNGAVAQLGEHLLCTQRVASSTLVSSTKLKQQDWYQKYQSFFHFIGLFRLFKEAFTFLDNFLRVTIPFSYDLNSYLKPDVTENVTENVTEKSMTDEEKIISAIRKNPNISTTELSKIIGKTRRTVARVIESSEKIVRVGPDKGGHWEIKK